MIRDTARWLTADAPITGTVVTAAVTLLVGLFGGGTLVTLIKVSADKGKIVIEAAQGAVIVQTGVIDALRAELNRVKDDLSRLRQEREDRDTELTLLRAEIARLRAEAAAVSTRVTRVEQQTDGDGGAA